MSSAAPPVPAVPSVPSYACGVSEQPLLGDTIGDNLDRTAAVFGDRDAMVEVSTGRRWTYREFVADVDALALGLLDAGLGKGDRVGIWAPNRSEWTLVQYATAKLGVILVNINPSYRTHELEYVLNQAGVRLLVAATAFKTSDYAGMITEVAPRCTGLERVVLLDSADWSVLARGSAGGDRARLAQAQANLSPDDPINIQYTSGTTGFPKGATLSHHNILNNGYFVGELCGYTEEDRICIPVPFYHCFGMVMGNLAATSHGAAMIIPAAPFDPELTLAAVAQERCTSLYGVPTMFIAELAVTDFESYDLTSLRTGIMAGSPCPVEVMKQVIARMGMTEVQIAYGMTETSPVSTQTRADDSVEWGEPEKTAEAIDAGRWMHTGDLAVMDDEGYLNITGRIKDMVIRGGENIYPREIEEFLYTHPDVLDAQVIGVPDDKYGEELCAWIRMRPGADPLTADTVREFATGKLARYKIPRYVSIVEEFPMTVTGKVRKVEMRARSVELLGLTAAAQTRTA